MGAALTPGRMRAGLHSSHLRCRPTCGSSWQPVVTQLFLRPGHPSHASHASHASHKAVAWAELPEAFYVQVSTVLGQ